MNSTLTFQHFDAWNGNLAAVEGTDGIDVKSDQVWLAYLICSVLRFGLRPEAVERALDESEYESLEQTYGWPIERMVDQAAKITYPLLDRAEALRDLLDTAS